ncbi:MAG: AAA family ATPase [Phycisphaerales bacterium]|nr:AAA family ATPase [Phycisphaerales bacterium]
MSHESQNHESQNPFQEVTDTNQSDDRSVVIKSMNKYTSKPIDWLEEGRIALGKLTLIAGDPGLGKSFITLDLASRVSRGELPSRRSSGSVQLTDQGQVVLLNAEDDAGDTIRPRLEAMGADLSRVHLLEGVVKPMGRCVNLTQLDTDVQLFANTLKKIDNLKLIVIDPISAYMGKTDSHNNADVRAVLAQLARLAQWTGAAVVCVTHLNKDAGGKRAIYRAMGSLAFTAAARAVHLVTKHPDDASKRVVAPVKNNLSEEVKPRVYRLEDGRVEWIDEQIQWDADSIESAFEGERTAPSAMEEAKRFLEAAMKDGARPSKEVLDEAEAHGITASTLQRARQALGTRSFRDNGIWHWVFDSFDKKAPLGAMRVLPEPDIIPDRIEDNDPSFEYEGNDFFREQQGTHQTDRHTNDE